jgi:hypothetical protein
VGTHVRLLYETVKLGRSGDDLYVEVHPDIYARGSASLSDVLTQLVALGLSDVVENEALAEALEAARGIPVRIGTTPHDAKPGPSGN